MIGGLTFFAGLGRAAIGDSDEAFYAEAGREMLHTGDWLTPRYNFKYRFQKPILFYWLIASTYLMVGVHEAAARAPAAAAGLAVTLLTFHAARRWYGDRAGLLAGMVAATSVGHVALARVALPDLPVAFFVALATYACLIAMFEPSPMTTRWWGLAGAASGLACLTKGPIGVMLPVLVTGAAYLGARRRPSIKLADLAILSASFSLFAIPWYVAMGAEHGTSYLREFLVGDNVERFATSRFNEPRSVLFYMPVLLGGMVPWTPFLLLLLGSSPFFSSVKSLRSLDSREGRLMLWWFIPLLFFTLSVGKQPRYVLPILPPLAILLGRALAVATAPATDNWTDSRLFRVCSIASGLVLVGLAGAIYHAKPVIAAGAGSGHVAAAAITIALSGFLIVGAALFASLRTIPVSVAVASVCTLLAMSYGVQGAGDTQPVVRMASLVTTFRHADEPVGAYRVMVRNLVFYTGREQADLFNEERTVDFLKSDRRVLCVLTAEDRQRLANQWNLRLRILATFPYYNLSTVKIRALFDADPGRHVQTIELVTNR